jgi:hypothetical protein
MIRKYLCFPNRMSQEIWHNCKLVAWNVFCQYPKYHVITKTILSSFCKGVSIQDFSLMDFDRVWLHGTILSDLDLPGLGLPAEPFNLLGGYAN